MKENKLSIDEVHKHLEELDESISHQKQVDQVLGNFIYRFKIFIKEN